MPLDAKSSLSIVKQKIKIFLGSRISKFLRPAQRYDDFKLIRITCTKKPSKTAVVLIAGVTISVPPAHHRTIWCRSTFGPRGPGLSNPTSFLRPALPMAPITDNNARDKRSVPRPNPATFLRDFTLYMTSNDAILWKRCLNYITCLIIKVYLIEWNYFELPGLKLGIQIFFLQKHRPAWLKCLA